MYITIGDKVIKVPSKPVNIEIIEDETPTCFIPKCKNVGSQKHNFCKKHSSQYKFEKPEECCVCLESLDNEKHPLLECGHWIHHECIILTGKTECPCCRVNVKLNREQTRRLDEIKNKNKREKEEEEQRELRIELERERSVMNRNTRWIDNRNSQDFFSGGRRTQERIQRYMDSDERVATVTLLQDLMVSNDEELRNDATVLFEMQSILSRLNNTEMRVSRRMLNVFLGITGVVEGEIRGRVLDNLF